jgi:hypothetical protein
MSPESIPQISLGTAVLVIFATCAGLVMLRGMTRMLVGTLVLALSAWIGFIVWQKAPTLSFEWFGKPLGFITTGAPVAAFLGSFFLIRGIARAVASPFGEKTGPNPNRPRSVIGLAALSLAKAIAGRVNYRLPSSSSELQNLEVHPCSSNPQVRKPGLKIVDQVCSAIHYPLSSMSCTIGLEVHCQVKTNTKIRPEFGDTPTPTPARSASACPAPCPCSTARPSRKPCSPD